LQPFTDLVYTITGENGKQFAEHLCIAKTVDKLNHNPRKCLDFKSPFEVFFDPLAPLQTRTQDIQ
jgi:IS30 family transposase